MLDSKIESKTCDFIDLGKALLYKDLGRLRPVTKKRDGSCHMRRRLYGRSRPYNALDTIQMMPNLMTVPNVCWLSDPSGESVVILTLPLEQSCFSYVLYSLYNLENIGLDHKRILS
jgi:hypothetical protein